jgi:hypothetical protein
VNSRLRAALRYAARKWRVLPLAWPTDGRCSCERSSCSSPAKHPLTLHGLNDATIDLNQIRRWWAQWPHANVGILTGGDLIVVDLDGPEAETGWAAIAGETDLSGVPTVRTGRGRHLFFDAHGPAVTSAGRLGKKIDTRGDGGYVVAVPSRHISGAAYQWEITLPPIGTTLPALPVPAARALAPTDRVPAEKATPSGGDLAALLRGPRPQRDSEGRNAYFTKVLGHLLLRYPLDDALALAAAVNDTLAEPLEASELRSIAASLDRAEQRQADQRVRHELERQRAQRAAKAVLDSEAASATWKPPETWSSLADELALDFEPLGFSIEQILPEATNVVLAAQYKTGKTTLTLNVAMAVVDQRPCLGTLAVRARLGAVGVWNLEMEQRQFLSWCRLLDIKNTKDVRLVHLKGSVPSLVTDVGMKWAVDWLRAGEVRLWVIDPWAALVAAGGLNENANEDVARLTLAIDAIKKQADVEHVIVVAHQGRAQFEPGTEHARGATRLDDWADVRWLLSGDLQSGSRFFRAYGRDVDLEEMGLQFDAESRRLTLQPGSRRGLDATRRLENAIAAMVDAVTTQPGISATDLRGEIRGDNSLFVPARAEAVRRHLLHIRRGNPLRHFPGPAEPESSPE